MSNFKMAHLIFYQKRTSIEEWRNFFILWHSKCWRVRKTSRAYKLKVNVKRGFATFLLNLANQNMHYWFTNEIIFLKLTFGRVQNYSKKPFPTNQMTQWKLIRQVLTTIFHNRLLHYWFSHHIFFWKWSSECSNATRSILPHKPSDTRKLTFRRDDNNLSQSIDALLIHSSHFFLKMKI